MMELQCRVGRLLEVRMAGDVTAEDIQRLRVEVPNLGARAKGKLVTIGDLREANLFSAGVQTLATGFMSSDNAHVEYVAMLSKSATLALQLNRLSVEARGTKRAVFLGATELLAWLEPHLLVIERQRAAAFLAGS